MKKKKAPKEDVRDPDVTYALTNSKSKTLRDELNEVPTDPISDTELQNLLDKPSWIWGGVLQPVMRIFKRFVVK